MTIEQLRIKHPRFVYKRFTVEATGASLTVRYDFLLEPDISFHPTVTIPIPTGVDPTLATPFLFRLGIVEAMSYWKAACPKEFLIEAGYLSPSELRFWHELLIHGLGELFYQNAIDFTKTDFVTLQATGETVPFSPLSSEETGKDLVLVGGGKDSALTLAMLKESDRTIQTMVLNPTPATMKMLSVAGIHNPIVVQRTIDPQLLTCNKNGYINGHTPFSAYLAVLGTAVGALYGADYVLVSNEKSANEANTVYRGMEINHQYSKTFQFETSFRAYISRYMPNAPSYVSFLRPFNDLQIGALLSLFPQYHQAFVSCNVGGKEGVWCGKCAKCAFTYLILRPFLSQAQQLAIFGHEYFSDEPILAHIRGLTGLVPLKPFECVGTRDESKAAIFLSVRAYQREGLEIPEGLLKIKSDLSMTEAEIETVIEKTLSDWGDVYNVPPSYMALLTSVWQRRPTV